MTRRGSGWFATVAALAALTGALTAQPVAAKKKAKPTLTATVGGKQYRWTGRYVLITNGSLAAPLTVIATQPGGARKLRRTIGIGCPADLTTLTFPHTITDFCSCQYFEQRLRPPLSNQWLLPSGASVTFESFDGKNIVGSFTCTNVPNASFNGGPIDIQAEFRGKVTLK